MNLYGFAQDRQSPGDALVATVAGRATRRPRLSFVRVRGLL